MRQLRTEFRNKGWMPSSTDRLLKKFRDMGTVDRRQGNDRPRSASMNENTDQVNDMVESRGPARTHNMVREISRKTGIPKSSVAHITWKDLQLNALRGDVCRRWLRWTALLVSYFWRSFFCHGLKSSLQMKRCSLWLQQWQNCENQLRFHRVEASNIKHVFKSTV